MTGRERTVKEEPFKLTLYLRTAMVEPAMQKPLDAILSWAAVQRAELQGADDPISVQHDLPLARHETARGWCFKASNLEFDFSNTSRSYLNETKRANIADYANAYLQGGLTKKPVIDVARGTTKAGFYMHPLRHPHEITAWGVGDIEALTLLMPYVTHIGKLRRRDCGAVAHWTIDRHRSALELWSQRPLPADSPFAKPDTHATSMGALVGPYWSRKNFTEIMNPV